MAAWALGYQIRRRRRRPTRRLGWRARHVDWWRRETRLREADSRSCGWTLYLGVRHRVLSHKGGRRGRPGQEHPMSTSAFVVDSLGRFSRAASGPDGPVTPYLELSVSAAVERYRALAAALPDATVHY